MGQDKNADSDITQTGCLINNADLGIINNKNEEEIVGDPLNGESGGGGGCYVIVSSPKDYEITTTFPLPYSYGFYGRDRVESVELDSVGLEEDVFTWERCELVLYIVVCFFVVCFVYSGLFVN